MDKDPFKEYIKQSEPSKRDKGYAWHTAIGLQAVALHPMSIFRFIKSCLQGFMGMQEN